jgi:hypothetical protein
MAKFTALATAVLAGSVSAFAPAKSAFNRNVALSAEKSKALPFMNRPALVSKAIGIETFSRNRWRARNQSRVVGSES